MKKMLPLLVVGILVLSGLGAVGLSSNDETELITNSFSFSEPMIEIEKEYININIAETNSFIMKQGKPMLPSYVETFTFPFGTKIKSVTGTPKSIQTQTILKEIKPTPQAVIVGQTVSTTQKVSVNYGTEPYPASWFEYDVGCGLIAGELSIIVETEFSPIKYYPAENTIEWANEVEIAIEYESPIEQPSSRAQYELVVIAPNEFSDELAPLITHKIGRGITAKFAGLSEVYGGTGRDNQEKIKYYIKNAIETWDTTNILLVGAWHDTKPTYQKLPARETNVVSTDPPDDEKFVSDLYYADIYDGDMNFCSWDADGDDVFGELIDDDNIDDVDLHPDVYLGRIPSRNGGEVTTMVNKIKTYENNEAYTKDWFTNLVVVGGDTSPDYDCIEGEYINQKVIDMMAGFTPTKLWVTNGKLTQYLMGVTNIKSAISAGCGFIDFSGHGNTNVWATHPEESHDWVPTPSGYILDSHIRQTTNGNKLPIIAVEACSTAKFNKDDETFNYAFLQNSNGGGIGAFGATALGWGYVGTGIVQGLIGKMGLDTFRAYRYDGAITLGEMWAEALERYIDPSMEALDYKTVEEWEPFGDPTLQIGEESNTPLKPSTPNGPSSNLVVGTTYTYTTSATDPDGDEVKYMFDWGDDTSSGWVGPYDSGQTGSATKSWDSIGTYEVKTLAKDEHGKVSDWSDELTVTVTKARSRDINFNELVQKFFENHPYMFPMLRQLLGF
ncbi:MAG: hypothetical protein KAS76_00405 [Thermoplasmatales archaeon]|nr:hypothetical protein [Thermoplasmatales archaeon]